MKQPFTGLKPQRLWDYFAEICTIPRPSRHEAQIANYLLAFAKKHGLEGILDPAGNVLIRKPASPGYEDRRTVILQSHMDMVGEKNSSKVHDFTRDPIEPWIDGDWIKAKGTTLGADDGIGIAASLAILESTEIQHPPLEALFTMDEETGLTGAFGLQPGFLQGRILLNLDSEDEGQIFIGCAGGKDTVASFPLEEEPVPAGHKAFEVGVTGLVGGHSGDDINKGRGNAVKILNRLLWNAAVKFRLGVASIDAGNLRNALAREGFALAVVPSDHAGEFEKFVFSFRQEVAAELHVTEPDLICSVRSSDLPPAVLSSTLQYRLLNVLYACPHGVIAMSRDIPNLVETSTNLASVKIRENRVVVTTSQRSSVESSKTDIADMVASVFRLAGGTVEQSGGYPGWKPDPDSEILKLTVSAYQQLFHQHPEVLAIHAGLECGLIGAIYSGMDMVSFGPTIKGAHSPDERLHIPSTEKFWDLLVEVLKYIPKV